MSVERTNQTMWRDKSARKHRDKCKKMTTGTTRDAGTLGSRPYSQFFSLCFLLVSHVVFVVSLVLFFLVFSCWLICLFFLCFVVVVSTVSKLIVLCFLLVFLIVWTLDHTSSHSLPFNPQFSHCSPLCFVFVSVCVALLCPPFFLAFSLCIRVNCFLFVASCRCYLLFPSIAFHQFSYVFTALGAVDALSTLEHC